MGRDVGEGKLATDMTSARERQRAVVCCRAVLCQKFASPPRHTSVLWTSSSPPPILPPYSGDTYPHIISQRESETCFSN